MTDAETAYAAAETAIAVAKAEGKPSLNLSGDPLIGAGFGALVDLPPEIAELTELEGLNLSETQVSDVSALAGMTGMQMLNLGNTQVSDISALADITGLLGLWLDNTKVSDISALAEITEMRNLWLSNTQVSDISTLPGENRLRELWLDNTQVSDISALAGMSTLQSLWLFNTQVSDISALAGMDLLECLSLDNTQVSDISALAGKTALQSLYLDYTQVSDLRPIKSLTSLMPSRHDGRFVGVSFANTPATRLDPKLETLSQIEDNRERTRQTLAYLNEIADGWPPAPDALNSVPPQNSSALVFQTDSEGRIALYNAPEMVALPPQAVTLHTLLVAQTTELRDFCTTPNREHDRICQLLDRYSNALGARPQAMALPPVLWMAGNQLRNALKADKKKTGEEMGESPPLGPDRRADLTSLVASHNAFSALHPNLVKLDNDQIDPVDRAFSEVDRDAIHQVATIITAQTGIVTDQVRADFAGLDSEARSNSSGAERALRFESESEQNLVKHVIAETVVEILAKQRPSVRGRIFDGTFGAGVAIAASDATINPVIAQNIPELALLLQPYTATLLSCWPGNTEPLRVALEWIVARLTLNP